MRLTPSISLVGSGVFGFGLSDDYDCHVYWIDGGDESALIDAGGGRDLSGIRANLAADGRDLKKLRYVLLTHYHADHAAGAALWRQQTGAKVFCAPDAAEAIRSADEKAISLDQARAAGYYPAGFRFHPCPVDGTLRDTQSLRIGRWTIRALDTPSQSIGHLCFAGRIDNLEVLFSGDAIFYGGTILAIATHDCSIENYARSIHKLAQQPVDVLLPGHGLFDLKNGARHIRAADASFRKMIVPRNVF